MIRERFRIDPASELHRKLKNSLLKELQHRGMTCIGLSRAMKKPLGTISILLLRGGRPSSWRQVNETLKRLPA